MRKTLSNVKEYITRKNMKENFRKLSEKNFEQKERIEELESAVEDKDRGLKVADKKFKEREDALQRKVKKYKKQYEGVNKGFYESKREGQEKDEKITGLKIEVEFHKSEKKDMEKSHASEIKEMEKSHVSKMKDMEKKMSAMNDEVEKEKRDARELMLKNRRLSKQIVEEDNRWQCLGVSEKDGKKKYSFKSPTQDVEKEPSTELAQIYKIPEKLNLSAVEKMVVEEDDAYVYIKDEKNNLSFRMPYQLYKFIRELLGKVVKEKYSGMDLECFAKPLYLSLLELREKKEPERESKIKTIEKFGRLNAGREVDIKEIADKCGISTEEAGMPLSRLCKRGVCRRVKRGCYIFKKAADIKDKP